MMPRGQLTNSLWIAFWLPTAGYIGFRGGEVFAAGGGTVLWLLSMAPIMLFLLGVARDSLQWMIWFCFAVAVLFVVGVEVAFARPNNIMVTGALIDLVLLFSVARPTSAFGTRASRDIRYRRRMKL